MRGLVREGNAGAAAPQRTDGTPGRNLWHWARRGIGLAFLLLVVALIVRYARNVDWDDVWRSLQALPARVISPGTSLIRSSRPLKPSAIATGPAGRSNSLPDTVPSTVFWV